MKRSASLMFLTALLLVLGGAVGAYLGGLVQGPVDRGHVHPRPWCDACTTPADPGGDTSSV
jgi:hypothetical protein